MKYLPSTYRSSFGKDYENIVYIINILQYDYSFNKKLKFYNIDDYSNVIIDSEGARLSSQYLDKQKDRIFFQISFQLFKIQGLPHPIDPETKNNPPSRMKLLSDIIRERYIRIYIIEEHKNNTIKMLSNQYKVIAKYSELLEDEWSFDLPKQEDNKKLKNDQTDNYITSDDIFIKYEWNKDWGSIDEHKIYIVFELNMTINIPNEQVFFI